jgi:hypothetical protein
VPADGAGKKELPMYANVFDGFIAFSEVPAPER